MRTQLIASLVSLSLSAGYAVHAQETLWFKPTAPIATGPASRTASDTTPLLRSNASAGSGEQSFSQRFGGLLSKPAGASSAVEATTRSSSATAAELDQADATLAPAQPTVGARDFRIPWSHSVAGAVPFEQATAGNNKSPAKPNSVGRGAQVSAWATDIQPNYVQPPRAAYLPVSKKVVTDQAPSSQPTASAEATTAISPTADTSPTRSRSLLATVPWSSAPRSSAALRALQPAEVSPTVDKPSVDKSAVNHPVVEKSATKPETAEVPAAIAVLEKPTPQNSTPHDSTSQKLTPQKPARADALAEAARIPPAASPLSHASRPSQAPVLSQIPLKPQVTESLLQPIAADKRLPSTSPGDSPLESRALAASTQLQPQVTESLIQPIPAAKLPQSPVSGKLPEQRRVAATLTQSHSAPHYLLVDTQQSASDLRISEQVAEDEIRTPAPAVTNRFSDQLETVPSVAAPARVPPPIARTIPQPTTPLLTTESMIGPLQGAESLFNRLEIEQDLRDVAARIESGPRGDAGNYAWMPAAYTWISPAFYHHPLFFEQPNLERYGVGTKRVLQPLASSIHFFGSIPLVPYKTLTHHPREKVYTLGSMRPGDCVPLQRGVILGTSKVGEVTMFWEECSGY